MAEEHFSYEANIELNQKTSDPQVPIRVDIKGVKFFMPVEISFEVINTLTEDRIGEQISVRGGMDLARQELSLDAGLPPQLTEQIKKSVFKHLLETSFVAEDKFEAKQEVYEQADRAKKQHDDLQDQNLGGN